MWSSTVPTENLREPKSSNVFKGVRERPVAEERDFYKGGVAIFRQKINWNLEYLMTKEVCKKEFFVLS